MKYLLGIDFGGGASKATLLGEDGKVYASSTCEYPTHYPKPGYAEQDPDDWVCAACRNIRSVIEKSGIKPEMIAAVALDAATHTAVVMDEDFKVIRPSIYWTDTRSVAEAEYLKSSYSELTAEQSLHQPDTIWTLPQLMWIKDNEPENWRRVRRIMFAKDYVRHCFTGDYVTDHIEAQGSMMFDVNKQEWSSQLCSILGLDTDMMSKIVDPADMTGSITKKAAELTGLSEGTPVVCGTTDTVMEVYAAGAVSKGQMVVKLATAGRICVVTDKPYPNVNLVNYSHVIDGLFYPGTATKSCAASYRWFRDTFGQDYKELDELAQMVAPGSDGMVFHPYLNGELTPYADPLLSADFVGVRAFHTKGHFARAVMEGVAMSMLDCKTLLDSLSIEHEDTAVIIGGGGKSPVWRQILSDALGIRLITMEYSDSSFGSAMLAGVAAGVFESYGSAVRKCNRQVSETAPDTDNTSVYAKLFRKYKAVQRALEPICHGEWE